MTRATDHQREARAKAARAVIRLRIDAAKAGTLADRARSRGSHEQALLFDGERARLHVTADTIARANGIADPDTLEGT